MSNFSIFILFSVFTFSCLPQEQTVTVDNIETKLIKKAINASGGMASFENIRKLSYKKTFALLDSLGKVEKNFDQVHEYDFENKIFKITSIESEDTIVSNQNNTKYWRTKNGKIQEIDPGVIERSINSSLYVLAIPFNLTDRNVELEYLGNKIIKQDTFEIIQANYDSNRFKNHSSSEPWRFYISKDNGLINHCWVQSSDHYNIVDNLSFTEVNGVSFYNKRKSYRSDSLGNKLYLRAAYRYYDYQFQSY